MNVKNPDFPEISDDLRLHSEKVKRHIAAIIQSEGPIPFSRFMALSLYAPGLGYYVVGTEKFGRQGDFVTAPEYSSLFSRCLARQCAEVLSKDHPAILEFGAGSGVMACDILEELQRLNHLPSHYYILELSADLQARQRKLIANKIPELISRVEWLNELPKHFSGIILANEVLDAMPVNLFNIQNEKILERCVDWRDNHFQWCEKAPSTDLQSAVQALKIESNDYQSEINNQAPAWIRSLSDCLKSGVVFLIDYGFPRHEYYHPQRDHGTLMCHFSHRAHGDPLILTGIQDITAHVDFTQIAEAAITAGLSLAGFCPQANFLLNCGLLDFLKLIPNPEDQIKLATQIKILTHPGEMGELFKVMALTKNFSEPLIGFQRGDQLHRL